MDISQLQDSNNGKVIDISMMHVTIIFLQTSIKLYLPLDEMTFYKNLLCRHMVGYFDENFVHGLLDCMPKKNEKQFIWMCAQ